MELTQSTTKAIFFDMDNTLFDHDHSMRSGLSAVQQEYTFLQRHQLEDLIKTYHLCLKTAYDEYLERKITYQDTEKRKIELFFAKLGFKSPSVNQIIHFLATYKRAYRGTRRATLESVETLVRLRENNYRIAIVTNGEVDDQTCKAKDIGVFHLVDAVITSEQAGSRKPAHQIFDFALHELQVTPSEALMVGDSAYADIKGALGAKIRAVLYSPAVQSSSTLIGGREIPTIQHMSALLTHLDIRSPAAAVEE